MGMIKYKKEPFMKVEEVLMKVKSGELSIKEAAAFFRRQSFEEMDYAKPDVQRSVR